jgi:hypothetical protein
MGSIRQILQAPKNIKKLSKYQIYQSERTFFQKKYMLSTLKKKRSQKFEWEIPEGVCKLNPKS